MIGTHISRALGRVLQTSPGRPTLLPGLLCLLALAGSARAAEDQAAKPPPSVVVATISTRPVAERERFIGTVKAIQSVAVKASAEGYLKQVAFEQGRMVKQGQLLYQIEQGPYQANLDSAQGQSAAADASLASALAELDDKQADFARQKELQARGNTSKTSFDQAKAALDEAKASVAQAKASQQQAKAALASAEIDLGYTTIRSAIDGRIGATAYTVGNLIDETSGTLATVVQLDPIRAVFSIPSADFVKFQEMAGAGAGDGQAEAARELYRPRLILPTGEVYAQPGKIAFADNQVDAGTGTIAIYADFPNPKHVLLPGQFINATVHTSRELTLPVVPAAAIQRSRDGEQVYVVGKGNRIEERTIETGSQIGSGYAVKSGLKEGERVVVSGIQKASPGVVVNPVTQATAADHGAGTVTPEAAPGATRHAPAKPTPIKDPDPSGDSSADAADGDAAAEAPGPKTKDVGGSADAG